MQQSPKRTVFGAYKPPPLEERVNCTIYRALRPILHYIWAMKASVAQQALPGPVVSLLVRLGADIATARRLRGISVQLMAERALVGRNTITRLERGDPGVSIGIYATVLFVLGMADRLAMLAAPSTDTVGLAQAEARAPKAPRGRRMMKDGTGT
jgi:hypothetical protein